MEDRRSFIKKASLLTGAAGLLNVLPPAIQKALAINPETGSTYLDAEHIVLLMQENRSFDHTYGTLQGVRGYNDPRAIELPNKNKVWLQSNKEGDTYAPFRLNIKDTKATWMSSLPHAWSNQVDARNNGKYDQWLNVKHSGNKEYAAMPLTMGYYTREDIPFYYALADAFTVCDQNFCSSLTGTTPNRLYFWTGTIREQQNEHARANVWNDDADHNTEVGWTTFPERLEDLGVSWKVYQNELTVDVGLTSEEDHWLGNYGDNPLEYFKQYHVKLSPAYLAYLPQAPLILAEAIKKQEAEMQQLQAGTKEMTDAQKKLDKLKKDLARNGIEQKIFTKEKYNQLSQREKNLHEKGLSTNSKDPDYHQLASIKYREGNEEREVKVPKGDILHRFRQDVHSNTLPTVSWLVAPENFSDHPSSAWYGAWYISEVMDILTKNPEVWKKTIFILTYDENDGYFDHVPPFVAPSPYQPNTGLVSKDIDTKLEYVTIDQQSKTDRDHGRESAIGLGYRVPMVIASPWSRGGMVCSEVFDHTSSLQFLEHFLSNKLKKPVTEPNISNWRRSVCGNLSSSFKPYNGEKIDTPASLARDPFVASIHKAKFKNAPSNFKKLGKDEIELINKTPMASPYMAKQEKGIRSASPLPYELYADGLFNSDAKTFEIDLTAANKAFGKRSAGSPFTIYARANYKQEALKNWSYAVSPGDTLRDSWMITDFDNGHYHLCVYGPNGFFREFTGNTEDPLVDLRCLYESSKDADTLSGNIRLQVKNGYAKSQKIEIIDNAYKSPPVTVSVGAASSKTAIINVIVDLGKSFGWYDFTVRVKGNTTTSKRYAGRVETGAESKTDPLMGGMI